MTNEEYNRLYNYTYRLPQDFSEEFDWIQTARTNYGKEILLSISEHSLPNVSTESFSLVRSVRSPGNVIGFLGVQLTGENLRQLLESSSLYDMEIMLLCEGHVLYQSEGFPWSEESVTDVRGLCGGLEKEYLTSSSQTQDSPLCVVTIVSKSDILHKNWGDFCRYWYYRNQCGGADLWGYYAVCPYDVLPLNCIYQKDAGYHSAEPA